MSTAQDEEKASLALWSTGFKVMARFHQVTGMLFRQGEKCGNWEQRYETFTGITQSGRADGGDRRGCHRLSLVSPLELLKDLGSVPLTFVGPCTPVSAAVAVCWWFERT